MIDRRSPTRLTCAIASRSGKEICARRCSTSMTCTSDGGGRRSSQRGTRAVLTNKGDTRALFLLALQLEGMGAVGLPLFVEDPLGLQMVGIHESKRRLVHVVLPLNSAVVAFLALENNLVRARLLIGTHVRAVLKHAVMR